MTRDLLEILGYQGEIATRRPRSDPGRQAVAVERIQSWMNGYGKLRRFTDKRTIIAEFYLNLGAALTVIHRLINRARTHYRWPTSPAPLNINCRSL